MARLIFISLLCSLCLPLNSFTQSAKIDSLVIALARIQSDTSKVLLMVDIGNAYLRVDNEKMKFYARQAWELSDEITFPKGKVNAIKLMGSYYFATRLYDSASYFYQEALRLSGPGLETEASGALINLAIVNQVTGNKEQALSYYLESDKKNIKRDPKLRFSFLNGIGAIYRNEGKYAESISLFEEALTLPGLTPAQKAGLYNNLGNAYRSNNQPGRAIENYEKALPIFININDKVSQLLVLANLAKLEIVQGNYEASFVYLDRGDELIASQNEKNARFLEWESLFRCNKAQALLYTGKFHQTITEASLAAEIAAEANNLPTLSDAYNYLHKAYAKIGDWAKAYEIFDKHQLLKDSLNMKQYNSTIAEMETRFESEKNKIMVQQLQEEKDLQSRVRNSLMVSIGLLFIVGILVFSQQRIKIKSYNKLIESYRAFNEVESKNRVLKEEALAKELEFKTKELTTHMLSLVQKNEIIEEIRSYLIALRKKTDITNRDINGILNLITHSSNIDKDWNEFRLYFEQVHKGFFSTLQAKFPTLSASELKLCALIKLNLSTKQSANLLGISSESVKMARYRLRKKLNLPSDQRLNAFLIRF